MSKQLIYNAIRTPDGTLLESHTVHDFKSHRGFFVDGGLSYIRRGFPDGGENDYEELSEYLQPDNHLHNREFIRWGSYGKEGNEPLRWILLKDMETRHIEIVLSQFNLDEWRTKAMETELQYRLDTAGEAA